MRVLKKFQQELSGIGFLLPNIIGFCVFTLIPLVASFALAFSNWNVQLHNLFKETPLRWVGWDNFRTLFEQPYFWQYFGNTLFLMMGIPFSIAGSLVAALLLNHEIRPASARLRGIFCAAVVLSGALMVLVLAGFGLSTVWMLLAIMASSILLMGVLGGNVVHRTLFYTPHFTAGVATYILWKKMYNPHSGPINTVLYPILEQVSQLVNALPESFALISYVVFGSLAFVIIYIRWRSIVRDLEDSDIGLLSALMSAMVLMVPVLVALDWLQPYRLGAVLVALLAGLSLWRLKSVSRDRLQQPPLGYRMGGNILFSVGVLIVAFILIGLSRVLLALPVMASDGLRPPDWLIDYHWAKPSIMIMALWAAIGSNNMILYLAGLKNIPGELYEAADIDGASSLQKFWHVTWPQLAPFTFFISVMSVIHGLQGGFEMARTMTQGGPAGSTTTLSYFIYIEGFETGRLGFASAVAWALFALVFLLTLFNVKFGNRYVND
jgi:multiple sugar transport system permease protein